MVKFQVVLLACLLACWGRRVGAAGGEPAGKYEAREISHKSQAGILRLRGFRAEVHYAITRDGYHLNLVRVVNPHMPLGARLKRPVLFNHGLFESSTIWLVNSRDVRARAPPNLCWSTPIEEQAARNNSGSDFRNAALLLANNGYDVWLLSMRGTDWSQYHEIHDRSAPAFWDYSLDQFALEDVPAAVEYIRRHTSASKVAYVGHSQGTFSAFALLATQPNYARLIEPVVALAPVAYFHRITSVMRASFLAAQGAPEHLGPVPESASSLRQTFVRVCSMETPFGALGAACDLIEFFISGGSARKSWPLGFFSHMPFYTSFKVLRHFGQLIKHKRFAMYDHGRAGNLKRYGQPAAPAYRPAAIESRALVLVYTRADTVSEPDDVRQFISELKVPLHRDLFIDRDLDHFDVVTHDEAGQLVNRPLLEILEQFEQREGLCQLAWPPTTSAGGGDNEDVIGGDIGKNINSIWKNAVGGGGKLEVTKPKLTKAKLREKAGKKYRPKTAAAAGNE